MGSVINYFKKLGERMSYNYVARLVFDPICRERIEDFYDLNSMRQTAVATALLEHWIDVYSAAHNDPKALVVPLEELDARITQVEEFLGHKSRPVKNKKWKRENPEKRPFFLRHHVDTQRYEQDIRALGYEI